MKKKKRNLTTVLLILILIVGLSLLLYPSVSDYWNSFHQTRVIAGYDEEVSQLDENRYEELWDAAEEYNRSLLQRSNVYLLEEAQQAEYDNLLNVSGTGIMGYIEIPTINCLLPIYHGTSEPVLQVAVGHLEWTSLPVGGGSTHTVLSGHRGLPSARLFSDLDKLVEGDVFMLRVLNEILTYEVDQILIVEPQDTKDLQVEQGKDYCTLVTCTPYGINSHRLLVRGRRVETREDSPQAARVVSDAVQIEPLLVAPIVAIPILFLLLLVLLVQDSRRKKSRDRGGDTNEDES